MKLQAWFAGLGLVALSLGSITAHGQFSDNNQTNTLDGSLVAPVTWTNDYYVGQGFFTGDVLILTNAGVLNNNTGYISDGLGGNSALVTGSGSVWSNSGDLAVGYSGSSNALMIANGGIVYNGWNNYGAVIGWDSGANGNAVTVTGLGSAWNNGGDLAVGYSGSGNALTIASSGTVVNGNGYIGQQQGANGNAVTVTGLGSAWNNSGDLAVGYSGSGNTLTIANGGIVYNGFNNYGAVIGWDAGASNNTATVTGPGSSWSNSGDLTVGYSGSGNTLTIANGGAVYTGENYGGVVIGWNPGASNNAVTVTDLGSVWSNVDLYVGFSGSGNALTITNGGAVHSGGCWIGWNPGANNNTVTVTGPGSIWSNSRDLYVGWSGSGNTLTITNGGVVSSGFGVIGMASGANSNAVTVTGIGSVWNISADFFVGDNGIGNTLTIANGGTVLSAAYGGIGCASGASNNAVTVTGTGSVWNNQGHLAVGCYGSGNTLTIANGGIVLNADCGIGEVSGANNNAVTVTGAGSVWSNSFDLTVGVSGSGNALTIAAGGAVYNGSSWHRAVIGWDAGANNNAVIVTGAGSVWSNSGDLFVGYIGSGNTLTIANGGTVYNGSSGYGAVIGWDAGANNNAVTVTGTGSVWSNSGSLTIGGAGCGNTLTVANGGKVCAAGIVGADPGASNNAVLVTGAGSLWNCNSLLDVRRGAVTLAAGGTIQAETVLLTNGANGKLMMSGGMLWANMIADNGSGVASLILTGGTLAPLSTEANWAAAMELDGPVTFDTTDLNGLARTLNISGALSGTGNFIKTGEGTINVTGPDSLAGEFVVSGGKMRLAQNHTNGNLNITGYDATLDVSAIDGGLALGSGQSLVNLGALVGGLSIASGALVTGGGHFDGPVTNLHGGFLTPGTGGDTNFLQSLTLNGASTNSFYVGSAASHDMSVVTNGLTGDSGHPLLRLDLSGYTASPGMIVLYDNLGTNVFDGTSQYFTLSDTGLGALDDGMALLNDTSFYASGNGTVSNVFTIYYDYNADTHTVGTGHDIALSVVPEPGAMSLMALLGAAFWFRHRVKGPRNRRRGYV